MSISPASQGAGRAGRHGSVIAWQPPPDAAQARHAEALARLARPPERALAVFVSLPFCAARCLFCDRDVQAARPAEEIDSYIAALATEIDLLAAAIGSRREVLRLHLGGGSATELGELQLMQLMYALRHAWRLPAEAELSIECDPRRASAGHLELVHALGFDSVHFGVLDLDPEVQRAIGRGQSCALVDDVCGLARACGTRHLGVDLVLGLPAQTPHSWQATLDRVLACGPDRIHVSSYRHHPRAVPAQRSIDADVLPSADACRAMTSQTVETFCGAGYRRLGAEWFVLDGDELLAAADGEFVHAGAAGWPMAPDGLPLLGLGAGACSEIDGEAFENAALPAWQHALEAGRLAVGSNPANGGNGAPAWKGSPWR
jgi:oxygen-independent coproporphyrinogen-3 oxidase